MRKDEVGGVDLATSALTVVLAPVPVLAVSVPAVSLPAPAAVRDPAPVDQLLHRAAGCQDPGARAQLLEEAICAGMPAARSIALRYRDRGEAVEDLLQVAYLGLVKAVHGFDAQVGTGFMAYAEPTITGEVRRWFRDKGWDIRPPRRLQDLRASMIPAIEELTQEHGRAPRAEEVAAHLGVAYQDVSATMVALGNYTADSLDAPVDGVDGPGLGAVIADDVPEVGALEDRLSLEPLLADLPPRDRHILVLRFYRGWTQREIAEDIGVTQMQVSRLLNKALASMREKLLDI